MVDHLHAISGLPRSGSTLLSAILQQNPRFHTAVTSPLLNLCATALEKMGPNSEFHSFFDDQRRRRILRSIFNAYYGDLPSDKIAFDTNRLWTARIPLLAALYPDVRVICCVRDIGWIIDSIERVLRENPLQHSRLFGYKPGSSVYGRAEALMNPEKGLIALAWSALREAWFGQDAHRLIIVRYERLTTDPTGVLKGIYEALGEPMFQHDFNNINFDAQSYDADLGMPGLHKVAPLVTPNKRQPFIPPELFSKHANLNFWTKAGTNARGVLVL